MAQHEEEQHRRQRAEDDGQQNVVDREPEGGDERQEEDGGEGRERDVIFLPAVGDLVAGDALDLSVELVEVVRVRFQEGAGDGAAVLEVQVFDLGPIVRIGRRMAEIEAAVQEHIGLIREMDIGRAV